MNNELHNDDILFDRLVDGELSDAERQALLESLDERPREWRRCALAFLEAQSWREEMRRVAAKPQAALTVAKTVAPNVPAKRTTMRAAAQWLAVAAGLLVAFKIGTLQRGSEIPIASGPSTTNEQLVSAPLPRALRPLTRQNRPTHSTYGSATMPATCGAFVCRWWTRAHWIRNSACNFKLACRMMYGIVCKTMVTRSNRNVSSLRCGWTTAGK